MKHFARFFLAAIFCTLFTQLAFSQTFDRIERDRLKEMLSNIKNSIKKNYYDEKYHGIDLEARFGKAEQRLNEVNSTGAGFAVIAQVLLDFNDSHLYFVPPSTTTEVEYGFRLKAIGDKVYVTSVKPKSDAEKQGLKAGDEIIDFEGFRPNRKELWKVIYYYYTLSPRTKLRLAVIPAGAAEPKQIEIAAKIKKKTRVLDLTDTFDVNDLIRESEDSANRPVHYFVKNNNVVVWKMTTFSFDPAQVKSIVNSEAKKGRNLILDLRGNGGGYVKTLEELAGFFFASDLKIADRRGRPNKKKENEPMMLKGRGADAFDGKLVVLIDSRSGSASEIFARLVQLEKRGVVIGDVSAGAVMQSFYEGLKSNSGMDREIYYGASITNADVIMSDGKSVEHVGVVPDELLMPTAKDLLEKRDPVLARALEIVGVSVTPDAAGKMFAKADEWDDD